MKRPAFQFYPADWQKDAALQSCSVCSRGVWIEMLCIMHQCEPYGYLAVNGRAMTNEQLARLIGETPAFTRKALAELEGAAVFSRDDAGCIFSRRMVKDERIRNVRAEAGKQGGNPLLLGAKDKQKVKQTDNDTVKQSPTPSSSSSKDQKQAAGAAFSGPWDAAKTVLEEAGMSLEAARSFVARCLKAYPDDTVKDAFLEARGSADPKAYVVGILKGKDKRAGPVDYTAGAR